MPKYRKLTILLSVVLITLLLSSQKIQAQAQPNPFQKAQADYSFQLTKHAEAREKFITARESYLAFQTAASKNEAFLKARDHLAQIHNVYIAYLYLIEERTNLFDWSKTSYKKDDFQKNIDDETVYLEENRKKVESTTTLEEIPPLSSALQDRLSTKTIPAVLKIVTSADVAQIEDAYAHYKEIFQKTDEFAQNRINDSNRQVYLNWKTEAQALQTQIENEINKSKEEIKDVSIGPNNQIDSQDLDVKTQNAKSLLLRTKDLLKEILGFL